MACEIIIMRLFVDSVRCSILFLHLQLSDQPNTHTNRISMFFPCYNTFSLFFFFFFPFVFHLKKVQNTSLSLSPREPNPSSSPLCESLEDVYTQVPPLVCVRLRVQCMFYYNRSYLSFLSFSHIYLTTPLPSHHSLGFKLIKYGYYNWHHSHMIVIGQICVWLVFRRQSKTG